MSAIYFGDTPLIDSARRGRTADVAALLAGGADVNEPNSKAGAGGVRDAAHGHARLPAAAAGGPGAAAPERAGGGARGVKVE